MGRIEAPAWRPPEPLREDHDRASFRCGVADLDDWLRERAGWAEGLSARTYVLCDGVEVVGYYCLATGSILRIEVPSARLRNLPDPVPMLVLGRLAVDRRYQGRKLGAALLVDAIRRALALSTEIGFRGILVHAIDEPAAAFYRKFGFLASPIGPLNLILPLETARQTLAR